MSHRFTIQALAVGLSLVFGSTIAPAQDDPTPAQPAPAPAAPAPSAPVPDAPADDPTAKPKPKPKPRAAAPKPKPGEPKPAEVKPSQEGAVLEPTPMTGQAVWPNGASQLSESYGDWTMNCTKASDRPDCVIIQSQGDRRTGRRQFSIELRAPKDGRAEGLILMPFGLQIEAGVTFKLDDRTLGKGAPYTYCVNDGCLVPISLPTVATDTMKTSQKMTVSGVKPDAKEPTVIAVPLSGFASAFARATAFTN